MKRKLLMTVATGVWISGALNYGAAVPALREDQQEAVLRQIQGTGERWAAHMWARPNLKIDVQALHTLTAQEKAQIQRVNDPVLNDLLSLGGEIGVEVRLETKELTAQKLYDFAMAVHKIESENHVLQIVELDALVQAFLEGHDAALVRLHEYAAFDEYAHQGLAKNLLGLIYGIGARVAITPESEQQALTYFLGGTQKGLHQGVINAALILKELGQETEALKTTLINQAKQGDREAAFRLSRLDPNRSTAWLTKAVQFNHPKAAFELADAAEKKDSQKAKRLYTIAAEQGYVDAMTRLIHMYESSSDAKERNLVEELRARAEQAYDLFTARLDNGIDVPLREANEYPAIREFPFTPWILSTLRGYQPQVDELKNALPKLTSLLQPWLPLEKDILFANNLSDGASVLKLIRSCSTSSKDFQKIGNVLTFLPQLTSLNLNLWENQVGDVGGKSIGEGLKSLTQLTSLALDLNQNQVGDASGKSIGEGLKSLSRLTSLDLRLVQNSIGVEGGKSIGEGLKALPQLTSLTLGLSQNQVGDASGKSIGEGLKALRQLTSLTLALGANQVGDVGGKSIGEGLKSLTQLTSLALDLSQNQVGDASGKSIGEGLKALPQLTSLTLGLSQNQVGDASGKSIGEGLKDLPQLTSLTLALDQNQVGDVGGKSIGEGLKSLSRLTSLHLRLLQSSIGDAGGKSIGEGLKSLSQLMSLTLYLGANQVGDVGVNSSERD